ncbi:MAG: hypothetical protein IJU21_03930 [Bacteroidales bacterium]|nr:hypothetical protein [Bacteroidales bacterium]
MARKKHRRSRLSQNERLSTEMCNDTIGIDIPKGDSPEDIRARKKIIGDFYAKWNSEHPDNRVWNESLNNFIYVKYHSLNETRGHASGTYESTKAVLNLTEIMEKATLIEEKPRKQGDNNQKIFSKIFIMKYGRAKLTVGFQPSMGHYVQYCITVPGERMHKK